MRTIPLVGKNAAGRIALVDDEDFELVSQHRWYVRETLREPPRRNTGPYAFTMIGTKRAGTRTALGMHNLITGIAGVDHRDHDGLNNQRSNLRAATEQQNLRNTRARLGVTSQYKGVYWGKQKRRWHAVIVIDGHSRNLGFYISEIEAALAYDDAARELFGEFACPNFPEDVPQAVRDHLRTEREAADTGRDAEARRVRGTKIANWWAQRTPETRVCTACGSEYLTAAARPTLYCGSACSKKAERQRARDRAEQPEPTGPGTRACAVCGRRFLPGRPEAIYCGHRCNKKAHMQRKRQRELEGTVARMTSSVTAQAAGGAGMTEVSTATPAALLT